MSEDLPWPEQGDSLFQESGRMSDAWIRPSEANFTTYAFSYREAAERLLKSAAAGGWPDSDMLIYPVVFLYRHHIELQLKDIITEWRKHPDHSGSGYMTHELRKLWRECRKIIEEVFPDSDDEATEAVEKVIFELAEVDPGSSAFRYPVSKNGNLMLDEERYIDIENLFVVMQKVSNYLDGSVSGVSEAISNR